MLEVVKKACEAADGDSGACLAVLNANTDVPYTQRDKLGIVHGERSGRSSRIPAWPCIGKGTFEAIAGLNGTLRNGEF